MYATEIYQLSYQSLLLILLLSAPPILISTMLGLVVAIFQAATQIQEQTLSFAPKMILVYLTIAATGGWVGSMLFRFATRCLTEFSQIVVP